MPARPCSCASRDTPTSADPRKYNLALGSRRAEAVRQFFVDAGLPESRFDVRSYGEERPREQGSNEESWAENRRDEFVITAGGNQIQVPGDGQ